MTARPIVLCYDHKPPGRRAVILFTLKTANRNECLVLGGGLQSWYADVETVASTALHFTRLTRHTFFEGIARQIHVLHLASAWGDMIVPLAPQFL